MPYNKHDLSSTHPYEVITSNYLVIPGKKRTGVREIFPYLSVPTNY
jgi:hypothetical protein